MEGGCGEDAGLAHSSAEHFAVAVSAGDGVGVACEDGADGCAEAFGETKAEGVAVLGEVGGAVAGFDDGVEEACAVAVDFHVVFVGEAADVAEGFERVYVSAAAVGGVFDGDEGGVGEVRVVGLDDVVGEAKDAGIPAVVIFPEVDPATKTPDAREAVNPENLVCQSIRAIAKNHPDIPTYPYSLQCNFWI